MSDKYPPQERYDLVNDRRLISPRAEKFLDDIEALFRKHGLSLAHEDHEGSFLIEDLAEMNIRWIRSAMIGEGFHEPKLENPWASA
jgi:hypothetical protein